MSELRPISGARFRERLAAREQISIDDAEKPRLHWIAIANLRVDPRYQRDLEGVKSAKNIIDIAANFSWKKFAPCVVAETEPDSGIFAIIDGQHRTTAAALRGRRDVPCLVVDADVREQARAFAAINGNVTAVSTLQMHAARVAAGEDKANAVDEACAAAGVTICRYPVKLDTMKVGETLAVSTLYRQLERYGRTTLVAALSCITKTGDGNPGFVRPQVVEAICSVLNSEPAWSADLSTPLSAMADFDFAKAFASARIAAAKDGGGITAPLVERVAEHLDATMAEAAE